MKKAVTCITVLLLICGMLTGCVPDGCKFPAWAPEGYSSAYRHPIVRVKADKPNDNTDAVTFTSFMKNSIYDVIPYRKEYPLEEVGSVTVRCDFSYNGELYYVERFLNFGELNGFFTRNWKYTVYQADGECIGTLTSDIAKGAMLQNIRISFLDEQYIYYQCENSIYVKRLKIPIGDANDGVVKYSKFAFFRFNLETYENEEISLALLFEKLVPIYPGDIKISPEYKGK